MSIPSDLRAVLVARRKAQRCKVYRPTLADLEQPGPDLSPAAFAMLIGMSREYVRIMLLSGSLPATKGHGRNGRWRISRASARAFLVELAKSIAA